MEDDWKDEGVRRWVGISIHVPRVEDDAAVKLALTAYHISIHVPRVEDDSVAKTALLRRTSFQSTSPVWRTTQNLWGECLKLVISIHVPRVEDDSTLLFGTPYRTISIHVPRVEDDCDTVVAELADCIFQSTSPVWRTTLTV